MFPCSLDISGKEKIHLAVAETEDERGIVYVQPCLSTWRVKDLDLHSADFLIWRIAAQDVSLYSVLFQRSYQPLKALAVRQLTIKPQGLNPKMLCKEDESSVVVELGVAEYQRIHPSDLFLP